jgi:hypothetical protein
MPPPTLSRIVLTGKLFIEIKASELGSPKVIYPNADLLKLHIEIHL